MSYQVVLAERAARQIDNAYQWWAENRSAEQATQWYNGLIESLCSLRSDPQRCGVAPENHLFPYEIRQLLYGLGGKPTHRALFTIRPNLVYVFSMRHLSRKPLTPEDV